MSNLLFTKVKTPNARLLFRESYGLSLDWNFHESKILQLIKSNPKLKLANNTTLLYFFHGPDDEDFSLATSWVAREIIGITPELDGEHQVYDIDGGEAYRFHLPLKSAKHFLAESIFDFYQQCTESLTEKKINFADAWRMGIASFFDEQEVKITVWMDFFENLNGENCG